MSDERNSCWCVIPVKGFTRAKSRLAAVLSPSQRASLARDLFLHVHDVCSRSVNVLVATDDPVVDALATSVGARVIVDGTATNLATVIDCAFDHARGLGASEAIVLMSDLPRLTSEDVGALMAAMRGGACALAPDHVGTGTNAFGMPLPSKLRTCFGRPDSRTAHLAAAQLAGLDVTVVERPGLAFDLDTPEDYTALSRS